MNDHDLDDLVMDTEPAKNHTKAKNPLTLFALVIIILILGIVFNKNFHQENKNPELFDENMNDFIAPELQLQDSDNTENNKLSSLNTDDETEMPSPDEPSVESLIAQRQKTPLDRMQVIEMPIERTQRTATKESKRTVVVEKKTEAPVVVKKVIQEKVLERKPIKEVERKPLVHKPTQEKQIQHGNDRNYYIQVGAFKNDPSQRLLSVITSTGFKYLITEPSRSGAKKLLIGPYSDKSSVNKALKRVQTRINKSAYVIHK
ncbi:membrane protein [hydrothermal vent metagenome]|uniref:Membrane protein n=1 Tax=hydrothermal vent metagenome TaxID=652676 RepID=A0A1W1CXH1_9ZZZZ